MRSISEMASKKFSSGQKWARGNTQVTVSDQGVVVLHLHGNKIAKKDREDVYIRSSGWFTPTTKDRLNAVLLKYGVLIKQQNYTWHFTNGTNKVSYESLAGYRNHYIDGLKWIKVEAILDALA